MKQIKIKWLAIGVLLILALVGCESSTVEDKKEETLIGIMAENEILSYEPIDLEKKIITFGKSSAFDEKTLIAVIEKRFPDIELVPLDVGAVHSSSAYIDLLGAHNDLPDIVISSDPILNTGNSVYDLSGEDFLGRYTLDALESMKINGKLFQVPLTSDIMGIFYNKTLFEQKGWSIPADLDEFYALCETISAEGIRPFVPSLKYFITLESVGFGLSYDQILADAGKRIQLNKFINHEVSARGLLEPMLETLKFLYDKGIVTDYDFTSSATTNRQELYAGNIAMIPYFLNFEGFYQEENPDCEIGMFGFPTEEANKHWMKMKVGSKISVSALAMEDMEKKKIILEILEYLSSDEGQSHVISTFSGISSVKSSQKNIQTQFEAVVECLEDGRAFVIENIEADESDVKVFQDWITGKITMEDILQVCDELGLEDTNDPLNVKTIGVATEDFSRLETSIYNADVMREATDVDIALLLNATFYHGNLARIYKGDIQLPQRFYLRGLAGDAYLTSYGITGENLRKLMEHPIVNGEEVNALYASSGLKMEYAPWAEANQNVLSLILADGSEIDDHAIYQVAAWKGTIDERYITNTGKSFSELGTNVDVMRAAIQKAGTISPVKDGRIQLNWEIREKSSNNS